LNAGAACVGPAGAPDVLGVVVVAVEPVLELEAAPAIAEAPRAIAAKAAAPASTFFIVRDIKSFLSGRRGVTEFVRQRCAGRARQPCEDAERIPRRRA
jgi:hypothetical protein